MPDFYFRFPGEADVDRSSLLADRDANELEAGLQRLHRWRPLSPRSAGRPSSAHSSGSPALRKPSITIDGVGVSVRSHLIVS